jgi:uncharacterized protein YkwD
MKIFNLVLCGLICLSSVVRAQGAVEELSAVKKARALEFLKSRDKSKRDGSVKAFRKLGDAYKATYKELLEKSRKVHATLLERKAYELGFAENSLTDFENLFSDWDRAREKAVESILTDWHKDKSKQAEMDRLFDKVDQNWERLVRGTEKAGGKELPTLADNANAIAELDVELAWCEGEEKALENDLVNVLKSIDAGDNLLKTLSAKKTVEGMLADFSEVSAFNAKLSWADSAQKEFAKILNARRHVLGLSLMKLDENLSKGCAAHSEEMKSLGYFAHESPTPETKTFTMRAQRAKFDGSASGECIFMGISSSKVAHDGWWYSDGHRLIMYAKGPNTQGLGISGTYWTLNTGQKKW